jgi:hypothetical protein
MPTIAISYRREDTRWIVGRIFDHLVEYYGHDNIFMDIDGVPLGLDFRDQIRSTLQRSDILLAVIGPQWLAAQKETGQPRIEDETDWVRFEIEAALGKKIPVIPVLIDRTPLPKPNELPEALREFAYRQATNIDTGVDFQSHMDRLIRAIDQLLDLEHHSTKSNENLSSDQPDRLADTKRSPVTLFGNIRSGLAQRRNVDDISARTPLISDKIGNIFEWVIHQANICLQVIKSPKDFVSKIDLESGGELGKSIQVLFFVLVCNEILRLPLDATGLQLPMFDPTVRITRFILEALVAVLFGSVVWLFGKAVNGKGKYRNVLVALLYSSVFILFKTITDYIGGFDKQELLSVLSGSSEKYVREYNISLIIHAIVYSIFLCYVAIKLVPLVRFVHSIGAIRALLVLACTFLTITVYGELVSLPLLAELVKGSTPH